MEIIVNYHKCIAEIWLARSDQPYANLSSVLDDLKGEGYTVVIFESGHADLKSTMLGLLVHNK